MKNIYFTPGPSQLYPTAPKHIRDALKNNICSISHRSDAFKEIFKEAKDSIRQLLSIPSTHEIAFLSSSLEVMERTIQNLVKKKSFHVVDGAFSKKWYEMAINLGKQSSYITFKPSQLFNQLIIPKHTEIICITHNETSIGIMIPMEEIYRIKKKYSSIPLALDMVSSFPYPEINFNYIDIAFFSVQKGLGLPAGLSVLIVNNKLTDRSVGSYHSFKELFAKAESNQTPETPNILAIYLMAKVAGDILKRGIINIRKETEKKAKLLYDYFDNCSWAKPFIANKKYRSRTVMVIEVKNDAEHIANTLKEKGMIIGRGYGEYKNTHIRIANFPQHSIGMIKKLIINLRKIKLQS